MNFMRKVFIVLCGLLLLNSYALKAQTVDSTYALPDSVLFGIDSPAYHIDTFAQHIDSVLLDTAATVVTDTAITPQRDTIAETAKPGGNRSQYTFSGVIKDKNTREGIPFATVFIPGTSLGTAADLDGNFTLTVPDLPKDTLRVQAMGYNPSSRKLDKNKKEYNFFFELERSENQLEEFVFHAGEDPAVVLLKQIIEHKPQNNPDRTENYKYEVYNKLEVDLQRLSKAQFEKLPVPYMKKFSFIYNNMDSTSEETHLLIPDELTPYIQVQHHKKEHGANSQHEIIHHSCIGLRGIFALGLLKEKRLGTQAKRLYE